MNLTQTNKISFDLFNNLTTGNSINQNTMNEINNRLLPDRMIRPNSTTNELNTKTYIQNRVGGFLMSPPLYQLSNSQNNNNNDNLFGSQNQVKYEMNTITSSNGSHAKINNFQPKTFKQFDQIKNYAALSGSFFDSNVNLNNNTANYECLIKEIEIIKNQFDEMKSCFISKCEF